MGNLILSIVDDIIIIQAERDNENRSSNDISSMLSHELVKLCTEKFEINILAWHLSQLWFIWINDQIAQIERDYRELREIYQRDHLLQSQLKKYDYKIIFKINWTIVDGKFSILRDFWEEIAMMFANIAFVELDFSILGWERDEYRLSLTDLSLEGIMQSKQHELLKSLIWRRLDVGFIMQICR